MAAGVLRVKIVGDSSDLQSKLNSAGGFATKWAKRTMLAVGGAVVGALGASVGLGIGRLLNIEDAQAKLRGLGHDIETIDQVMSDALASVKGTAFGLDAAATAAAGAIASGVQPGKDLERTLRLMGDTATIAGAGFDEMGAIFNKVGASNRLSMEEVNQLADRGIPIMQFLADQYGVTAEAAREMVSDGKVDFEAFRQAIETNISGAALASGDTTRGAFENMKAAAARFGAALIGPVFGDVKGFFLGVTEWIDRLTAAVQDNMPLIEQIIGEVGDAFGALFGSADDSLSGISDSLRTNGNEYGAFSNKALLANAAVDESHRETSAKVREALLGISSFITETLIPTLENIRAWWDKNGPAIMAAATAMKDEVVHALGVISRNWKTVETVIKGAVAFIIGRWVAMRIAALYNAGVQIGAWLAVAATSTKSAATQTVSAGVVIGRWVAMAAAASTNALKIAGRWAWAGRAFIGFAAIVATQVIVANKAYNWLKEQFGGTTAEIVTTLLGPPGQIVVAWQKAKAWFQEQDWSAIGRGIAESIVRGMLNLGSWVAGQVRGFIERNVTAPIRNALRMRSPSRVMMELGRDTIAGFNLGMLGEFKQTERQARVMAKAVAADMVRGSDGSSMPVGARRVMTGSPGGDVVIRNVVELDGRVLWESVKRHAARDQNRNNTTGIR